jgi:hypothetical protein
MAFAKWSKRKEAMKPLKLIGGFNQPCHCEFPNTMECDTVMILTENCTVRIYLLPESVFQGFHVEEMEVFFLSRLGRVSLVSGHLELITYMGRHPFIDNLEECDRSLATEPPRKETI